MLEKSGIDRKMERKTLKNKQKNKNNFKKRRILAKVGE